MKRIKDLRTRGIGAYGISRDASVAEAVREFVDKGVGALVVYDGRRLVGIFTKNDLVRCCAELPSNPCDGKVADFMETDVFTATIHSDLEEVIDTMVKRNFRHVPVLDGDTVVGMVTPIDILVHEKQRLAGEHEELRRYIQGLY